MKRDMSTQITGWAFVASAVMFWFGWMLLPVKVGTFFQTTDFADVYKQFHLWIWMFRIHLFGVIVAVVAMVALGSVLTEAPARVLVWPGVAVATIGLHLYQPVFHVHALWMATVGIVALRAGVRV